MRNNIVKELKMYMGEVYGNMVEVIHQDGVELVCCGKPMKF
ncbi:MAG: desulfoferrodoxin FeS4 iron-binding domain-containing protein [Planctomycetota bacterium]|jgi:desulfoferrodoxin-like iron-binding protein